MIFVCSTFPYLYHFGFFSRPIAVKQKCAIVIHICLFTEEYICNKKVFLLASFVIILQTLVRLYSKLKIARRNCGLGTQLFCVNTIWVFSSKNS